DAETFNVFGPRVFERDSSRGVVHLDVDVLNPSKRYVLRVSTVDEGKDGDDRSSRRQPERDRSERPGARVVLNGVAVVSPQDFTRGRSVVERAVELKASNDIAVDIQGPRESEFRVEILGFDDNQPLAPLGTFVAFGPRVFETRQERSTGRVRF